MVLNGQCAPSSPMAAPVAQPSGPRGLIHLPPNSFCRFSVNKRIFVVGFGLYGSIHGPTDYQVNIQVTVPALPCQLSGHAHSLAPVLIPTDTAPTLLEVTPTGPTHPLSSVPCCSPSLSSLAPPPQIIHTDSNTVLGQNDTGFSCDGSASTFRVMFKEPVEVLPNVNYTACATLKVGAACTRGHCPPIPPSPAGCGCPSLSPQSLRASQPHCCASHSPPGPGLSLWHQRLTQGDS